MLYKFKEKSPEIGKNTFVAPGSKVIGEVKLADNASIWYNTVVRADHCQIKIGKYSNIQDNSTVHVERNREVIIGDYVTVGHNAVLHACTIEDNCLIAMNATILSGAVIGAGSIIGAGAVVAENQKIPAGSLVVGVPAKVIRKVDKKTIQKNHQHALKYSDFALENSQIEIIK